MPGSPSRFVNSAFTRRWRRRRNHLRGAVKYPCPGPRFETAGTGCYLARMASRPNRPKGRSLRSLRMVWSFALNYPGHIAVAALALLIAAAAWSAVPYGFKLIIDKGFGHGAATT